MWGVKSCGKEWKRERCENGWGRKKKREAERWIIVTQIVQATVICLGKAKSHFAVWSYYRRSTLSRGQQNVFQGFQKRWLKQAPKQRREREEAWGGLCEVGAKQVGSSSAADWGLCLQEICWNLPLPGSQPGVLRGDKSGFYPGRPRHLNNEPEQQKQKLQLGCQGQPRNKLFLVSGNNLCHRSGLERVGVGWNPILIW